MSGSIRIADMPDLGAFTDTSSIVGERSGSGRFSAHALRSYIASYPVDVKQYGAKGDGLTNDTAAITAALATFNGNGGTLIFPPGVYLYTPTLVVPDAVTLNGQGGATLLAAGAPGTTCIMLGTASKIRNVQLTAQADCTAGAMVFGTGNGATVSDCYMLRYYIGLQFQGASPAIPITSVSVHNVTMNGPPTAASAVSIDSFSSFNFSDMIITGASTPYPQATFVIGRGDTGMISRVNSTHHGALKIIPAGGGWVGGLRLTDVLCDIPGPMGAAEIIPGPAAAITDLEFTNCWFSGSTGANGLDINSATGAVSGLLLANCQFYRNSANGLVISGAGCSHIAVSNAQATGNGGAGILINGGSHLSLIGVQAGTISANAANGTNGINVSGAVDYYVIQGCNTAGNTGTGLVDTASGTHKSVTGNIT